MLKRIAIYALTGIFGLGLGAYTALAMSGLLPGDRRAEAANAAPDFLNEEGTSRAGRRDTHAWAHFYRKGLTSLGRMSESEDDEEDEEDEEEESPPPPPPRRPPLIDEDGYVPPPPPPEQSHCVVS